jgi:NADH-quinone oxidoreductase subunit M
MMMDPILLLILLLFPLLAAGVVVLLGPQRVAAIRWTSVAASLVTLLVALIVAGRFMSLDRKAAHFTPGRAMPLVPKFQPEFVPGAPASDPHATTWDVLTIGPGTVQFYIGMDGLNIWLVVLTAVLMLPSVLVSWNHITERRNQFYAWLLALQTCMIGIFLAFDILLFYIFFELSLVPLFFLIGIWGGPERQYAARKFFIYTLTGSLLTLLGVLGVVLACFKDTGVLTFSLPRLVELVHTQLASLDPGVQARWQVVQYWVFLALTAGFAVKVPLIPLHTWLPLAHVEAPTAGSVDLAGVLLKVGAYGFLRLCIPLAPDISLAMGLPMITALATIGIVYGAFCAYSQDDVKRMIAYSSVSHLGLCMVGMFSLNVAGLSGSIMQMINHGLSTGALFLLIGMIYERYHTRKISHYSGMAGPMPLFAVLLVFTCLSSVGLPGLNGFIGEVLCLAGIFDYEWTFTHKLFLALVASSGIILGAWYLFTMTRRLLFGTLKEPNHSGHAVSDLSFREISLLAPLLVLFVVLGVYPQPVLRTSEPDVQVIADIADAARFRAGQIRETAVSGEFPAPHNAAN